jgi:hypothetical protein
MERRLGIDNPAFEMEGLAERGEGMVSSQASRGM